MLYHGEVDALECLKIEGATELKNLSALRRKGVIVIIVYFSVQRTCVDTIFDPK